MKGEPMSKDYAYATLVCIMHFLIPKMKRVDL